MSVLKLSKKAISLLDDIGYPFDESRNDDDYFIDMEDRVGDKLTETCLDDPDNYPLMDTCYEILDKLADLPD